MSDVTDLKAELLLLRRENAEMQDEIKHLLIKQQHTEDVNANLRELVKDLHALAYNVLPQRKSDYMTICSVEWCIDYYSRTMPAIEQRMRELGVEV